MLRCQLTGWIADQPQPGLVEARIIDASARTWIFVDKAPIFTSRVITRTTPFPVDAAIRCEITGRYSGEDGLAVMEITTIDVDSIDGQHRFEVKADQVFD